MTGPSCSRPRALLEPGGHPRASTPRDPRDPPSHPRDPPGPPRDPPSRGSAEISGAEFGAAAGPPRAPREQPPWSRRSLTWWSCRTRTRGTWSGGSSSPRTAW